MYCIEKKEKKTVQLRMIKLRKSESKSKSYLNTMLLTDQIRTCPLKTADPKHCPEFFFSSPQDCTSVYGILLSPLEPKTSSCSRC